MSEVVISWIIPQPLKAALAGKGKMDAHLAPPGCLLALARPATAKPALLHACTPAPCSSWFLPDFFGQIIGKLSICTALARSFILIESRRVSTTAPHTLTRHLCL